MKIPEDPRNFARNSRKNVKLQKIAERPFGAPERPFGALERCLAEARKAGGTLEIFTALWPFGAPERPFGALEYSALYKGNRPPVFSWVKRQVI